MSTSRPSRSRSNSLGASGASLNQVAEVRDQHVQVQVSTRDQTSNSSVINSAPSFATPSAHPAALATSGVSLSSRTGLDANSSVVQTSKINDELQRAVLAGMRTDTPIADTLAQLEALLREGADLNATDKYKLTPLHMALSRKASNGSAIVDFLINRGANVNAADMIGRTPLHFAASHDAGTVLRLLAHGAEVNAKTQSGSTPLHVAAQAGELASIKHLVERNAVVGARDDEGNTPLLELAGLEEKPDLACYEFLISGGAEVNVEDNCQNTPFSKVVSRGHFEAAEFLLAKGANINVSNHQGKTPLHDAAGWGAKFVKLMLDRGAANQVHCRDRAWGNTPLHIAMRGSDAEAVRLLLKAGADADPMTSKNKFGQSVLGVAKEIAKLDNIRALCEVKGWAYKTDGKTAIVSGWMNDRSVFTMQVL